MWLMLQQEKPDDFVLATGETHSIREFVEKVFEELDEEIVWEGKGLDEKGILKKSNKIVVEVSPKYFRPTEVEMLIGDATKAKNQLNWQPKTKFNDLIKIMVKSDYDLVKKRGY